VRSLASHPILTAADLVADRDVFRLDFDPTGAPANPVLLIEWAARQGGMGIESLARRMRASDRVVVLIAGDVAPPEVIVSAADVILAPPGADLAGAAEAPAPVAAARDLADQIGGSARASIALAWLLRESERRPVPAAITAESSVYSTLMAGPDFRRWLAARGVPRPPGPDPRVRMARHGDELRITLTRPGRRNAVDAAMRDALRHALELAVWEPALRVTLDAEGPSFCAGGDLDEFGAAPDPATAHLIRVAASVGRMLHELRDRVTVRVHGDCIGAGLELPAFAGRVVASPDARLRLPEVAMGLIPGAGGTVSLPRRIGRARTAWLALTGAAVDADTALRWGLVDAIE
jgi:enoyl-CoA hydratase/carnithine racemase